MRSLAVAVAALIVMACPVAASADTNGSATTTTGETLTVSLGYPGDGLTEYGRTTAFLQGAATLRGGSGATTRVARVAVGFGDAYEAPGSTYVADARLEYEGFSSDGQIAFEGTRKLYVTAVAEDGTRATANVTLTLDPRWRTRMTAFGALYDWRLPEASEPALRAALYRIGDFGSTEPVLGAQIIFYVGSERVCDAISGASESIYATCTDPAAIAKVVSKGDGYTAVFRETDTLNRATGWGASMQTQIKHFP